MDCSGPLLSILITGTLREKSFSFLQQQQPAAVALRWCKRAHANHMGKNSRSPRRALEFSELNLNILFKYTLPDSHTDGAFPYIHKYECIEAHHLPCTPRRVCGFRVSAAGRTALTRNPAADTSTQLVELQLWELCVLYSIAYMCEHTYRRWATQLNRANWSFFRCWRSFHVGYAVSGSFVWLPNAATVYHIKCKRAYMRSRVSMGNVCIWMGKRENQWVQHHKCVYRLGSWR